MDSKKAATEDGTSPDQDLLRPGDHAHPDRALVVGDGAFAMAMATAMARRGSDVRVLCHTEKVRDEINAGENKTYLPGYKVNENIRAHTSIEEACAPDVQIVLLVIPTQFLRTFLVRNLAKMPVGCPIVVCAKGIEVGTAETPYEMMLAELPGKYHKHFAVLAGPSFAKEIMDGEPTNVVVASEGRDVATVVARYVSDGSSLRAYVSDDVHGIEIAGAVKNVLAIASGALDGLGFGNNARAALVCRGLAELTRLAVATGSNGRAMAGLAGVGDLMLTCSSSLSRNFTVGKKLASGMTLEEISGGTNAVAEGVATAKSVRVLAGRLGVEMPICDAVYRALYEGLPPREALAELQARPLGAEGGLVAGE
eukprot:CAMPEP_0172526814 /NCGR_PEP_ID=MMETSP1067-20121228/1644_1 /TAXON_ID=265564 ORGANISM="Thalassiosira punctigera, Strain Tpunct2005C2" /NCGR_SAMPLE_ID=MMETSP1067 /ASSEMBLY_ACC=CAM_ASM_000444 /LENGTH=366 /DNA_ID=CAMNT_0013310409 /DNA_START=35 /DNA_END=1135 /DNA_ORIENTATION=+